MGALGASPPSKGDTAGVARPEARRGAVTLRQSLTAERLRIKGGYRLASCFKKYLLPVCPVPQNRQWNRVYAACWRSAAGMCRCISAPVTVSFLSATNETAFPFTKNNTSPVSRRA